ncbi:MAG: hypothetical protein CSA33_06910 [Desulfobulbus propionicus]|nr:MAG: hypothetical protein CSA33_06910 [Desulfobulbus propionicus]
MPHSFIYVEISGPGYSLILAEFRFQIFSAVRCHFQQHLLLRDTLLHVLVFQGLAKYEDVVYSLLAGQYIMLPVPFLTPFIALLASLE